MKKMVWMVVGLIVVIGAVVLIGRERMQGTQERTAKVYDGVVPLTSSRPDSEGSRRGGSGAGQSPLAAGDTMAEGGVASAKEELSDAVRALVGLDGKEHNYPSLLKAINDLDYELSATDVAALREMLEFPNDRFPEKMRSIEINAVKNDVLDKLLRQRELSEGLGLQMVEMAGNAENDPVWRDYCMQFCPTAWERIDAEYRILNTEQGTPNGNNQSEESVDELSAIHDAMFLALDERDSTIAGTALIGLENLSRTHAEFDRSEIVAKASEIALDETASAASRLTALRLSAQISNVEQGMLNNEVQEAARSIAQTGETVLLRSAAIVTLGEVGSSDDRELLESYLLTDNRQIAAAAKMALAKMDAR